MPKNYIQTTKFYTKTELEKGQNLDFEASAKKIKGIALLSSDSSLYPDNTILFQIDSKDYLPRNTPTFLLLTSLEVSPNQRFLKLAGKQDLLTNKFYVKLTQPTGNQEFALILLLEK